MEKRTLGNGAWSPDFQPDIHSFKPRKIGKVLCGLGFHKWAQDDQSNVLFCCRGNCKGRIS